MTLTIARLVVREALRRRLLLALLLLTITMVALSTWGFSRIPTLTMRGRPISPVEINLISSQFLILVAFLFSQVLGLSAVFVAAPAIAGEVESGTALALLSRPIGRGEYVIGKWLGLAFLVSVYAIGVTALEFPLVAAVTGYSPPHPFEFVAFLIGEALVLLTFALALSTRVQTMVGGVIAVVLFGVAWIAGVVGGIGAVFENVTLTNVGTISKLLLPTDGLWRGAIWSLEPASLIALAAAGSEAAPASAANPFFAAAPPPLPYLVWCVAWIAGVLALAVWSFRRREV